MNGEPNRVAGVCSGLPLGIQDLMWGTDNARVRNKSDQRILKSTARILCDMCPIQPNASRNPSSAGNSTAESAAST